DPNPDPGPGTDTGSGAETPTQPAAPSYPVYDDEEVDIFDTTPPLGSEPIAGTPGEAVIEDDDGVPLDEYPDEADGENDSGELRTDDELPLDDYDTGDMSTILDEGPPSGMPQTGVADQVAVITTALALFVLSALLTGAFIFKAKRQKIK
ncbi:MAG: hypothetical protein FWB75_03105, partial [Oscillospiraceae bacterium]|nr:hypothetical protein [Oscillospiraceae bacterium]